MQSKKAFIKLCMAYGVLSTSLSLAQTGTELASITPHGVPPTDLPITLQGMRGIAFDGQDLYFTTDGDPRIIKIDTTGQYIKQFFVGSNNESVGGPLAWRTNALWTMNYDANSFALFLVNPANGAIISSCDIALMNPGHPAVVSQPNVGHNPDGLDWTGRSFWVSGGRLPGVTPNQVVEVESDCSIVRSFTAPSNTVGVAFAGDNMLWHASAPRGSGTIQFQTDVVGVASGSSFTSQSQRDLACDSVTFPGKSALWGLRSNNGEIRAYEVPSCESSTSCGNGIADSGEQCDGADLHSKTCLDIGFDGGTLACSSNCRLDFTSCSATAVLHNGLSHGALGGATLELQGIPEDALRVGNINESGHDGVAIDVGEAIRWSGELAEVDLSLNGEGLTSTAFGQLNGVPDQLLASIRFRQEGGARIFDAEFPVNNGGPLVLRVFDESGNLMAELPDFETQQASVDDGDGEDDETGDDGNHTFTTAVVDGHSVCTWHVDFDDIEPTLITVGGTTYMGASMSVETVPPNGPPPDAPIVAFASQIRISAVAPGGGAFMLLDESVIALADTDADGVLDNTDNCTEIANPDQRDTNADNIGNICDGDFNGDCIVDFLDLNIMKETFFSEDPDTDMNGDGTVSFTDLGLFKSAVFGPPGPSAVDCN